MAAELIECSGPADSSDVHHSCGRRGCAPENRCSDCVAEPAPEVVPAPEVGIHYCHTHKCAFTTVSKGPISDEQFIHGACEVNCGMVAVGEDGYNKDAPRCSEITLVVLQIYGSAFTVLYEAYPGQSLAEVFDVANDGFKVRYILGDEAFGVGPRRAIRRLPLPGPLVDFIRKEIAIEVARDVAAELRAAARVAARNLQPE